jgi:hypothetical protein
MNKEFIPYEHTPYEQALALKELGFDEPCFGYYNIDPQLKNPAFNMVKPFEHIWCLPAPLYQQAFRWFREKHGIFVSIVPNRHGSLDSFIGWIYVPLNGSTKDINVGDYKIGFNTPEEAELACLIKLIEIVKNK